MRSGMSPEALYFGTKNQHFMGFNLSADFCAEHEWGIKNIKESFGINSDLSKKNYGMQRMKITEVPANCLFFDRHGKDAILVYDNRLSWRKEDGKEQEYWKHRELRTFQKGVDVFTAWSEDDFAIFVKGNKLSNQLEELYNAILKKDAVIFVGGDGHAFKNAGLIISILSKVPKVHSKTFEEADLDTIKLCKASDKTKIVKKIDKINDKEKKNGNFFDQPLGYHALSPRWVFDNEKDKTKHDVIYYLNPRNQRHVNFGWFTVEELEEWIKGKGPIPRDKVK